MSKSSFGDNILFTRLSQGDEQALESLLNKYYKLVTRTLSQYSEDPEQIKDWTQEIFIMVWEKRAHFEHYEIANPRAYFLMLARNFVVRDLSRKKKITVAPFPLYEQIPGLDGPEDLLFHQQLHQAYDQALERLPNRIREVYQYNREEGLSYSKIAEKLSISVKTVESQISRALFLLRRELMNYL
ncbi:RNA polymerase sigma factor [Siphonobacter curvatus]|uniref:RNA polymerase sigma-70 factor n=1 Tax=Siphonobacter curvatus TaxID=2094562 RepID=A0A2S7IJZ8_9BACT|nr:sigma-70 family RNA polymerase sigma factor [Siphonobacter curvatus]PQA56978.1 hypothetical protein C5O19_16735 [Siphonobacter curvatus]